MSIESLTESHCEKCTLKESSSCFFQANVFNNLRDRSLDHDRLEVRSFRAREVIFSKGKPYKYVAVVSSGSIKRYSQNNDGVDVIDSIGLPGSFLGMPFVETPPYNVEAASDVFLCCLDRKELERLVVEDRDVERAWLISLLSEQELMQRLTNIIHLGRAFERIGSFFLAFCEKKYPISAEIIHIPISRFDLACLLGTTPETISRCVQLMVKSKTLSIVDNRKYKVLDLPRLEEIAGTSLASVEKILHGSIRSFILKESLKRIDLHRRAKQGRLSGLDVTKLPPVSHRKFDSTLAT